MRCTPVTHTNAAFSGAAAHSYVRSRIGQSVKLRLTPEIRFLHDDSLDELEKV